MNRSYRFRLSPTRAQAATLTSWLELGCELYNTALQHRRDIWQWRKRHAEVITEKQDEQARKTANLYGQGHSLAEIRILRPEFETVPIAILRGWLGRLNKTFIAFFRRCETGEVPGFPRFKSIKRFDTIDNEDIGRSPLIVAGGKRIHIQFIGKVRFHQHRPIEGTPKGFRITKDGDRWWVAIQCIDVPTKPLPTTGLDVGIDLGLATLLATSDGEMYQNPRALQACERGLKRAQRKIARRKNGSNRRRKAIVILRQKHEHVTNIRRESAINIARMLVRKYDTICVEDLNIKGLAAGRLSKSIGDAAWGTQLQWIRIKAEEAGREVIAVDPRGTSQECSGCGKTVKKDLKVRIHDCPDCGLVLDRDVNAARNILSRGRRDRGGSAGSQRPMIRKGTRRTVRRRIR